LGVDVIYLLLLNLASRCVAGMLNGNVGVVKSMMAEITDSTNIAQASALLPVVWAVAATIGPLAGGSLAYPHDRFPKVFRQQIWKDYPHLLPCLFSASVSALLFLLTLFFF